jgi:hypothetical protein
MRLSLVDSPRNICHIPKTLNVIMRVISGDVIVGRDRQTLADGGGLPVGTSDGIVTLAWDAGALFMAASPAGASAVVEVVVPE